MRRRTGHREDRSSGRGRRPGDARSETAARRPSRDPPVEGGRGDPRAAGARVGARASRRRVVQEAAYPSCSLDCRGTAVPCLLVQLHPLAQRFADVADAYERGRPEYPPAVVGALAAELEIPPGAPVLDLGAGTGKLSAPL